MNIVTYISSRIRQKSTWLGVAAAITAVASEATIDLKTILVIATSLGLVHVNEGSSK